MAQELYLRSCWYGSLGPLLYRSNKAVEKGFLKSKMDQQNLFSQQSVLINAQMKNVEDEKTHSPRRVKHFQIVSSNSSMQLPPVIIKQFNDVVW